jgi:uncharacterized membrane protein
MNDGRFVVRTKLGRFAAYGLLGWCAEVLFTGIHGYVRDRDNRLPSRSSIWMFPIYGLLSPLYEPLHDAVRNLPVPARATVYAFGLMGVEYSSGVVLRRLLGQAPWDYSDARRHINGLVRPDYFPLWAAFGLGLEPVHDILTGRRSV